jgi:hypothetical protein
MKRYSSAIFLASIVFLWRFQVGGAQGALPIYVFLAPLILLIGWPRFPVWRSLLLLAAVVLLGTISLLQGIPLLSPTRFAIGIIVFTLALTAGHIAIMVSTRDRWHHVSKVFQFFLLLQLCLQLFELIGLTPFDNKEVPHYFLPISSPTGLFSEPSHLAMSYSIFLYAAVGRWRLFLNGGLSRPYLFVTLFTLLLCPSATLLAILALALLFNAGATVRKKFVISIVFSIAVTAAVFYMGFLVPDAVLERVGGVFGIFSAGYITSQTNLSAAVFFGGARAAWLVLTQYPFGAGFLNMASIYHMPEMSDYLLVVGAINISDGGSILFKLVSEFGYIGLLLCVFALIRLYFARIAGFQTATIGAMLFPFAASMVRGASYFDGPVLLGISIILFGAAKEFLPIPRVSSPAGMLKVRYSKRFKKETRPRQL